MVVVLENKLYNDGNSTHGLAPCGEELPCFVTNRLHLIAITITIVCVDHGSVRVVEPTLLSF